MKRLLVLVFALLTAPAVIADTLSFTVIGIDCAACAPPIVRALKGVDGVKTARVDTKTAIATIEVPAGFDRRKVADAISKAGFEAVFPGETRKDIEALPADVVKTLDIVTFNSGKRVDIGRITVPGKVTVVDFYGDWCGPCRVLEARLQRLMQGKKNIALRRVDIGKWDNDAAKQATREFKAEALPYVRFYDARGKFVTAVTGGMWDEILDAIEKAERCS